MIASGASDTLASNAGVFVSKPFTDYTAEDYALVTRVNLAGFFWLTQRAIGQMLKQHSGHVVNISASIADHADSVEPTALAALTKDGLAAVTRSLAVEYASRGIRVNAVAPGIIQTPLHPAESCTPEALAGKLPPLGKVINKRKVGKHIITEVTSTTFTWRRDQHKIAAEAALDGIYVIRTSVTADILGTAATVAAYKDLKYAGRDFRITKAHDLDLRPIYHYLAAIPLTLK